MINEQVISSCNKVLQRVSCVLRETKEEIEDELKGGPYVF